MTRVGVLALQGDVREHLQALARIGVESLPVRRESEIASIDGLIIPGGESTAMWKLAHNFHVAEPIRRAIKDGLPVYGTCAGMIMMAERIEGAIDGQESFAALDITVRRNAFGRQVDSFEADLDLPVLGDRPFRAVFIRAPWVQSVGDGVEVLGTTEVDGEPRIVAVREGSLLATSFHPEISGDDRVHEYFVRHVMGVVA